MKPILPLLLLCLSGCRIQPTETVKPLAERIVAANAAKEPCTDDDRLVIVGSNIAGEEIAHECRNGVMVYSEYFSDPVHLTINSDKWTCTVSHLQRISTTAVQWECDQYTKTAIREAEKP